MLLTTVGNRPSALDGNGGIARLPFIGARNSAAVGPSSETTIGFIHLTASIVKGQPASAREAASHAEMILKGKAGPTAPLVVGSLDDLKIGFTPVSVRTGKLIGVVPQGTIVKGAWTGLERFYQLEGGGVHACFRKRHGGIGRNVLHAQGCREHYRRGQTRNLDGVYR